MSKPLKSALKKSSFGSSAGPSKHHASAGASASGSGSGSKRPSAGSSASANANAKINPNDIALGSKNNSKNKSKNETKSKAGGKAKHTVSIAKKPTRFKGPDLESGTESEGNASGFEDNSDYEDVVMHDAADEKDTDEEIERGNQKEGKKVVKRKRPPTTASAFGTTLTSLLADPMIQKSKSKKAKTAASASDATASVTPTLETTAVSTEDAGLPSVSAAALSKVPAQAPILALSAHKPPTKSSVSLELKARRALKAEKEEKEDRARIRDVVEGWANGDGVVGGQEFERGLRKTAQRGVIKLFNAILQASKNAEEASGSTSLAAQAKLKPELAKKKEKDNILGRGGKEDVLTKENFLDLVRKGSTR